MDMGEEKFLVELYELDKTLVVVDRYFAAMSGT